MAFRLPSLSLVIPTDALPNHAVFVPHPEKCQCMIGMRQESIMKSVGIQPLTSSLVHGHNGTSERRRWVVELLVEGAQRQTRRDDARVVAIEKASDAQEERRQEGLAEPARLFRLLL